MVANHDQDSQNPQDPIEARFNALMQRLPFNRAGRRGDEDPVADGSQHAQKLQDDQAAAARESQKDQAGPAEAAEKSWGDRLKDMQAAFVPVKTVNGVRMAGDEITIYCGRKSPMTPEKLQAVIQGALNKGWTEIYAFDRKGKPDQAMMQQINNQIIAMGLQDKISIGRDPALLGKNINQVKSACRLALKGVAVGAAAAGVAAGAAALAGQLVPQ